MGAAGGDGGHHRFQVCGSTLITAVISCLAWMTVSSGLILLNKDLLSHGFAYPMTLSGSGMLFSSCASFLCCKVFKIVNADKHVTARFYVTRIVPVGFCMAATLAFGNLVYLYLTVSFIQILKSFTPVLTMIGLFLAGLETPTRPLVLSVVFIALGTALASAGEVNLNMLGLLIMALTEVFEAIRLVMTQFLLVGLKFHPIEGLMYLAPACTFWLLLGSLATEIPAIRATSAHLVVIQRPMSFLAAAFMGFLVNSLAYIVIQTASSLTLKVLGPVKSTALVVIGIVFLGETVTGLQGIGYSIAVVAFLVYQHIKMQQIGGSLLPGGGGKGSERDEGPPGPKYSTVPAADREDLEKREGQI